METFFKTKPILLIETLEHHSKEIIQNNGKKLFCDQMAFRNNRAYKWTQETLGRNRECSTSRTCRATGEHVEAINVAPSPAPQRRSSKTVQMKENANMEVVDDTPLIQTPDTAQHEISDDGLYTRYIMLA